MVKYNNREWGFKTGHVLELGCGTGDYRVVTCRRDIPAVEVNLGAPLAGTRAVPIQGTKTQVTALTPKVQDVLVHALLGVEGIVHESVRSIGVVGGAAATDVSRTRSLQVRYWSPRETPMWLSPDGNTQAYIDWDISPVDDPNEMYPIYIMHDDIDFYLRGDNPWTSNMVMNQYVRLFPIAYDIAPLQPGKIPDRFSTIPYVRSGKC